MNYADARRIADQSAAPKDSDLYDTIGSAASDLGAAENSVRTILRTLRSRLDDVEQQLDQPDRAPLLNDLGALQGTGPAFDVAIAKFSAKQQELQGLLRVAAQIYPVPAGA